MRWLGRLLAGLDPDRADAARWARIEREAAAIAARRAPHLAQIGPHPASAACTDDLRWRNGRESDTEIPA